MITAILGGGEVPSQLHSDVGKISPVFLPIASEPSIFQIVKTIELESNIYIMLQSDIKDLKLLERIILEKVNRSVTCIPLDSANKSLIETFIAASQIAVDLNEKIEILFADTITTKLRASSGALVYPVENADRWTTCNFKTIESGKLLFYPKGDNRGNQAIVGRLKFDLPNKLLEICKKLSQNYGQVDLALILQEYISVDSNFVLESTESWIDLGHLDTYFRFRKSTLSSRSFNDLTTEVNRPTVTKTSADLLKLRSEINWYQEMEKLPDPVAPRLLDWNFKKGFYRTEWIPFLTVGETLSFANLDAGYWESFVRALDNWSQVVWRKIEINQFEVSRNSEEMFIHKLIDRWNALQKNLDRNKYLEKHITNQLVEQSDRNIEKLSKKLLTILRRLKLHATGFHGDPVFSNLFFDVRSEKILSIDPRGKYGSKSGWGTTLYDLAKISQSFFGKYDIIAADLFDIYFDNEVPRINILSRNNLESNLYPIQTWISRNCLQIGLTIEELRLFEASLWFSLAVLHNESPRRQVAAILIANEIVDSKGDTFWDS